MAVEILRKKGDGTMEKLDIGGEVDLSDYYTKEGTNEAIESHIGDVAKMTTSDVDALFD